MAQDGTADHSERMQIMNVVELKQRGLELLSCGTQAPWAHRQVAVHMLERAWGRGSCHETPGRPTALTQISDSKNIDATESLRQITQET